MTSFIELTAPLDIKKYRFCYLCLDEVSENAETFLDCGHLFCRRCISFITSLSTSLSQDSNNNSNDDISSRLDALFKIAQTTVCSQTDKNEVAHKTSNKIAYSIRQNTTNNLETTNVPRTATIECPVCSKLVKISDKITTNSLNTQPCIGNTFLSVATVPGLPMTVTSNVQTNIHCDYCSLSVQPKNEEDAAFFCHKCALNFCQRCRLTHDQMPLFKEHLVVPISGKYCASEQLCRFHKKLVCVYFCLTCKLALCSLCVLLHSRFGKKNDFKNNPNNENSASCSDIKVKLKAIQSDKTDCNKLSEYENFDLTRTQFLHFSQEQQSLKSSHVPEQINDYPALNTVTNRNCLVHFEALVPASLSMLCDDNQHTIVKYREALGVVRDQLKSGLNQLGSQIDSIKQKLKNFAVTYDHGHEVPFSFSSETFCSSSSSSSTISPAAELENSISPKQKEMKKRHFSSVEKNVARPLRSSVPTKASEKDKESDSPFERFKMYISRKPSTHTKIETENQANHKHKEEVMSVEGENSDFSDHQHSWSSSTSVLNRKRFSSFRKRFTSGLSKPLGDSCSRNHATENDLLASAIGLTHEKSCMRKLSACSPTIACTEHQKNIEALSEKENEFVFLAKMLISKYIKLLELSTKSLESSYSKRLFHVYESLAKRVEVILKEELILLEQAIEKKKFLRRERQRLKANRSAENLRKSNSTSNTTISSLSTSLVVNDFTQVRTLSGFSLPLVKQKDGCVRIDGDLEESLINQRTMLARPHQRWKYERGKNDLDSTSVPCAAVLVDSGLLTVVAEYDNANDLNNRLQVLSSNDGRYIETLLEGQIQPLGIALSRDQNLVVTDCKSKRVKIVSLETKTVVAEMGKGMFGWPCGVAVTSRGQIVVSDVFNDSIFVFSSDGKRLRTFGSSGGRCNQLRNPYHLAVDTRDRIYISDNGNNCVKVFTSSGQLEFTSSEIVRRYSTTAESVGDCKSMNRKLRDPRGVAVDECGNFFVADDFSRVCMFDSTGKFCRYLLTEEDSLKSPEGLSYSCLNHEGVLLLTEWSPSNLYSVKMFSLHSSA